jgi:NADH dehydrogenase [ubiquinone] 1 alpha subcomplex assembly factor 7
VGPLFGAVLARALDAWWAELGRPDPFVVVEAAAGRGALCRAVLDAGPACSGALRYLMVERSERLRAEQASLVPVEPAFDVLGPVAPSDEEDEDGARVLPGRGPRVASLPSLPAGPIAAGVVVANELLDNLPFALLAWSGRSWDEVRVGVGDAGCEEVLVPAAPALAEEADRLLGALMPECRHERAQKASCLPAGARIPLQHRAAQWVRDACGVLASGRVVVFDYAVESTASLAARDWREWVRTYRGGVPGGHPLEALGDQDVTCEVCVDQLARARPPVADRSQAEFLAAFGVDDLVAEARSAWQEGAAGGTLASLAARSRVSEAAALTDLGGLGGFRVLEWTVP